jgi:hypothetical protein
MLPIGTDVYFPYIPCWGKVVNTDKGCYIFEYWSGPSDGLFEAIPYQLINENGFEPPDPADSWKEGA